MRKRESDYSGTWTHSLEGREGKEEHEVEEKEESRTKYCDVEC